MAQPLSALCRRVPRRRLVAALGSSSSYSLLPASLAAFYGAAAAHIPPLCPVALEQAGCVRHYRRHGLKRRGRQADTHAKGQHEAQNTDRTTATKLRAQQLLQQDDSTREPILYAEEDTEGMAEFMEEYDELLEDEGELDRDVLDAELPETELEVVQDEQGNMVVKRRKRRETEENENAMKALMRRREEQGGRMTEEDWFEFLRLSGLAREMGMEDDEDVFTVSKDEDQEKGKRKKRMLVKRIAKPKFIDRVRVVASGGKGGKGCISFEQLGPSVKRPSGGHGGQGGEVVFVADLNKQTLDLDRHHFHGKDGANGDSQCKRGARGAATIVRVPCGTVVKEVRRRAYDKEGDKFELVEVCDLDEPASFHLAAAGGRPGLGNSAMASKMRTRTSNQFRSPGHVGEQKYYELELKTIADVGLVGYPNAGKSTLLGSLSRARPKVAPYPFTTLHPMVGRVEYSDATHITVADLPGLIDGAHANRGLGHEFLRHVERTHILLYVLDGSVRERTEQEREERFKSFDFDRQDPEEWAPTALTKLQQELELYCPGLSDRPSMVWINKADLSMDMAMHAKMQVQALLPQDVPIFVGSAMTGSAMEGLAIEIRRMVEATRQSRAFPQPIDDEVEEVW